MFVLLVCFFMLFFGAAWCEARRLDSLPIVWSRHEVAHFLQLRAKSFPAFQIATEMFGNIVQRVHEADRRYSVRKELAIR